MVLALITTLPFSPNLAQANPKTKQYSSEGCQKVRQARQRAEEARKRAKRAALRRLDRELTYENLLERRVRVYKGLEPEFLTGNQTIRDYIIQQYENVEREYAAPVDKYADVCR